MKFIYRILLLLVLGSFAACDMLELDLQDNPNAVTAEKASVNDLYNNIQLTFAGVYGGAQFTPGQATRMYNMGSFSYEAATSPTTFTGLWRTAYSTLFPDIDALLELANERGLDVHAGTAKIMKAYTLMTLVDLMGNVPLSEAGQGTDVISPKSDSGADVYAAAGNLLDEAISQMSGTSAGSPPVDMYYGGDAAKWVTLAKTLKLRIAVTTRLVNGGAASEINSLVSAGDIIDTEAEDFQFNFGNQRNNPNSRHPFYLNHYETGDGVYLSNYFMWLLAGEKIDTAGTEYRDPRLRFYFYRKVDDAVGQDPTTYSCHFSTLPTQDAQPAHWRSVDPRLPYCVAAADGYSGRDHGNGEGIPPDGPIRTSYGLYPGGGSFDDNSFTDTRKQGTTGGLGQGIWPIMMSSFVDFLRAEAALTIGTNDDPRALLESGMRKSIAKVISFKNLVPAEMGRQIVDPRTGESNSVEELFVPNADDIDEYVNFVLAQYDAGDADTKLDVVMKEYLIALWGNGLEAYNMYRRTGKPNNMQPTLEPTTGIGFIYSYFYPDQHVNLNANATQKSLSDRVFWDDGSANVY